ncbi:type II secretion system protein [Rossellomorea sp. FM04394]|uniref:type II secretion system protein n=1 Tax=Rossellomorea sp. FM04394 TaxID=3243076 RepID=UPI0035A5AC5E
MLKKMKKMLKNERGLTLVELLAVIVILGIIAAIAVPSIGGVIKNSKEDAKVAEALQIIDAARLSHAENPDATKWKQTEDTATNVLGLKDYVSKVKDDDYTVTYDSTSRKYSIEDHEASTTKITEDELAKKAR